ncbi:MAG: 1-acyl-sn-glycerol-3-phosphate acyltransferase [Pseudomonadota bacterium]
MNEIPEIEPQKPNEEAISKRPSITLPAPKRMPRPGAMLHRWGFLGRLFGRIFFSRVFFPPEGVEKIRDAEKEGTVMYVMRMRNTLEFLYFNYVFLAHGLPVARFANGVRLFFWLPLRLFLRRVFSRRHKNPAKTFQRLTSAGRSSALFLRSHDIIPPPGFEGPYLQTLVELQRKIDKPIMLVPLTIFWGNKLMRPPEGGTAAVFDRLLGNQDEPRMLRRIWQVLRFSRYSLAAVGSILNLHEFLRDKPENQQATRALDLELMERIEAERRVKLGPRRSHFVQIRRQILLRDDVLTAIRQRAASIGQSVAKTKRYVRKVLRKMQAQCTSRGILRMSRMVRIFFGRAFEGFEVDEAGIAKLQETAKKGPLLFIPVHRSHVDYMVLSDLLWARGIVPPHVAAGINLAFWPMSWLLRASGAFFLRRKFHGDTLYSTLLRAYVHALLAEAHTLEVFIEGGRTRTGRIMPPRVGLLSVVAGLTVSGEVPPVYAVPVSIGYERVLETSSVTKELSGAKKQPESFAGVVRAGSVLLSKKEYGFINVQFGEPIDVREFLIARGFDNEEVAPEIQHNAIRSLGFHVLADAGRVTAITPTSLCAAALLASGSRGSDEEPLRRTMALIGKAARIADARFVKGMWSGDDELMDDVLDRATIFLVREQAVRPVGTGPTRIFSSQGPSRIRLDYYKNQILQHVVDVAFMASVLRAFYLRESQKISKEDEKTEHIRKISLEAVRTGGAFVGSLVRLHFVAHAGRSMSELIELSLQRLELLGLVRVNKEDQTVSIGSNALEQLSLLAGLVENLMESQSAVTRGLLVLRSGPRVRKELEEEILEQLRRWYLTGVLHRYESWQKPLVKTAIDWLCEEGILVQQVVTQEVEISLARQHADGRALEVLIERINGVLSSRG